MHPKTFLFWEKDHPQSSLGLRKIPVPVVPGGTPVIPLILELYCLGSPQIRLYRLVPPPSQERYYRCKYRTTTGHWFRAHWYRVGIAPEVPVIYFVKYSEV